MTGAARSRRLHGSQRTGKEPGPLWLIFRRGIRALYWLNCAIVPLLLGWGMVTEARTSYLQACFFTWFDHDISYHVAPGASLSIRFPEQGPYEVRLGYAEMPEIIQSLEAHQLPIVRQAR
jgi:hypothetical protein